MLDRLEVISYKQTKSGKTFAVRLGNAVVDKAGTGWNLYLDALPAPEDGVYKIQLRPPLDRGQPQRDRDEPRHEDRERTREREAPRRSGLDDDIPF